MPVHVLVISNVKVDLRDFRSNWYSLLHSKRMNVIIKPAF
jgi:ERCC4-type nuclease